MYNMTEFYNLKDAERMINHQHTKYHVFTENINKAYKNQKKYEEKMIK